MVKGTGFTDFLGYTPPLRQHTLGRSLSGRLILDVLEDLLILLPNERPGDSESDDNPDKPMDSGTWSRKGNSLTLISDAGHVIVVKKR